MTPEYAFLYRVFFRLRSWFKRKRYVFMHFWNRFKWCVLGGFAYAAGRFLFQYLQSLI